MISSDMTTGTRRGNRHVPYEKEAGLGKPRTGMIARGALAVGIVSGILPMLAICAIDSVAPLLPMWAQAGVACLSMLGCGVFLVKQFE